MRSLHLMRRPKAARYIGTSDDGPQSGINLARRMGAGLPAQQQSDETTEGAAPRAPTSLCDPDQVPAGFFGGAFCVFAGAGGGAGARSMETRRPPAKR